MKHLRIHIDQIVVHGLHAGSEQSIRETLTRELSTLFSERADIGSAGSIHRPVINVQMPAHAPANAWPAAVARAIAGEHASPPSTPSPSPPTPPRS